MPDDRLPAGQADLPAMGMAGEKQVGLQPAGAFQMIRKMRQDNARDARLRHGKRIHQVLFQFDAMLSR